MSTIAETARAELLRRRQFAQAQLYALGSGPARDLAAADYNARLAPWLAAAFLAGAKLGDIAPDHWADLQLALNSTPFTSDRRSASANARRPVRPQPSGADAPRPALEGERILRAIIAARIVPLARMRAEIARARDTLLHAAAADPAKIPRARALAALASHLGCAPVQLLRPAARPAITERNAA